MKLFSNRILKIIKFNLFTNTNKVNLIQVGDENQRMKNKGHVGFAWSSP